MADEEESTSASVGTVHSFRGATSWESSDLNILLSGLAVLLMLSWTVVVTSSTSIAAVILAAAVIGFLLLVQVIKSLSFGMTDKDPVHKMSL